MKKLPTILALVFIYLAVFMNWSWVWGVIFLFWTIPSLYSGEVNLVQTIKKRENPILFWVIIVTWLALSAVLIINDFYPLY